MPYLETSQAFLEQSSLLLEAYPESTRITTRYSYPSRLRLSKSRSQKPRKAADASDNVGSTTTPIATLTLKTYNPSTGICLKYRTDKAAEIGRLISGLGKLASGAKISDPGTTVAPSGGTAAPAGEIDIADAPTAVSESGSAAISTAAAMATATATATGPPEVGKAEAGGKGGKSKKKGGKGKR
jgi:hypothetical protein